MKFYNGEEYKYDKDIDNKFTFEEATRRMGFTIVRDIDKIGEEKKMEERNYMIINDDYELIQWVTIADNPNRPGDPDDDDIMQYYISSILGLNLETHKYITTDYMHPPKYLDENFTPEDGWNC